MLTYTQNVQYFSSITAENMLYWSSLIYSVVQRSILRHRNKLGVGYLVDGFSLENTLNTSKTSCKDGEWANKNDHNPMIAEYTGNPMKAVAKGGVYGNG